MNQIELLSINGSTQPSMFPDHSQIIVLDRACEQFNRAVISSWLKGISTGEEQVKVTRPIHLRQMSYQLPGISCRSSDPFRMCQMGNDADPWRVQTDFPPTARSINSW